MSIQAKTIRGTIDASGRFPLDHATGRRVGIFAVNRGANKMELVFDEAQEGFPLAGAIAPSVIGGEIFLDQPGMVCAASELAMRGTAGDAFTCIISYETDL